MHRTMRILQDVSRLFFHRAFETSKIIDSTTVTADQIISIDSTKYYALDSNTLMEI